MSCTQINCISTLGSNFIVKFAVDTAVEELISNDNEKACLKEAEELAHWYHDDDLLRNISKTKEMIVEFGKKQGRN